MGGTERYAVFLAAACLLAITLGPGIFYVAARSLSGGRKEGVASSCGTGLGGMVHVFAGSLGVSAIVLRTQCQFKALRSSAVGHKFCANSHLAPGRGL